MSGNQITYVDPDADLRVFHIAGDAIEHRTAESLARVWGRVPSADRKELAGARGTLVCVCNDPAPVPTPGVWEERRATIAALDDGQLDAHLANVLASQLGERRTAQSYGLEGESVADIMERWGIRAQSGAADFATFVAGFSSLI